MNEEEIRILKFLRTSESSRNLLFLSNQISLKMARTEHFHNTLAFSPSQKHEYGELLEAGVTQEILAV